jgi:hypothetical protein
VPGRHRDGRGRTTLGVAAVVVVHALAAFAADPPASGDRVGVRVPEEHVIGLDGSN